MSTADVVRALNLILYAQYIIPEVKIQVFTPKGFKASIRDSPNLGLFVFQGNINRPIGSKDVGSISGEVIQATNGWWIFEDPDVVLKVGDVINYYVYVSVNSVGYVFDNLNYTVTSLDSQPGTDDDNLPTITVSPIVPSQRPESATIPQVTQKPTGECRPTVTTFQGKPACAGQTIFEENFNSLREDIWQVEEYIPTYHIDYPFVSYQQKAVSVADGILHITASLQQNSPGFSYDTILDGSLDLSSGCTSRTDPCYMKAPDVDILPPVVTGRVVTRQFTFTYGTVHVRAKLPEGDWLYPEILLEPFVKRYGSLNHASGLFKIACAKGNKILNGPRNSNYGNQRNIIEAEILAGCGVGERVFIPRIPLIPNNYPFHFKRVQFPILYGGAIIDSNCRGALLSNKTSSDGRNWGDDFHVYSLRWAPERIILSVDGVEYARIHPPAGGLRRLLPPSCQTGQSASTIPQTSNIAPLDHPFFITLGVNAGGISEFEDGLVTEGDRPKPWVNHERKARLNFFKDQEAWFSTWTQSELLVDYVKVIAI